MTLRDLFTDKALWAQYGDMDVYNDVFDDMAPCWCGTLLTKSGQMHFDNVLDAYETLLDTEIEINESRYGHDINVKLDDYKDYNARWRATKDLFSCAAGYCGCDEYDEWFADGDEDEPSSEEPMDILEGYLADTGATVYLGCGGWVLVEDGDEMSFGTWQEMIEYIKEA